MSGLLPAGEKAYARLLRQIVSGKRPAGAKLPEEALCAELGVSRTPLREALLRLEKEGLVERRPRYGCTVRRFDPHEVRELFECRAILEAKALEMGFASLCAGDLTRLRTALEEVGSAHEDEQARSASLAADRMLHALVAERCPNRALRQMVLQVQTRTAAFRDDRGYRSDTAEAVHQERLAIIAALEAGDCAGACRLLEAHIRAGGGLLQSATT